MKVPLALVYAVIYNFVYMIDNFIRENMNHMYIVKWKNGFVAIEM